MAKKRFLKGLFKDMSHIDQPEGTWRYAKNAIINEKKGEFNPLCDSYTTATSSVGIVRGTVIVSMTSL